MKFGCLLFRIKILKPFSQPSLNYGHFFYQEKLKIKKKNSGALSLRGLLPPISKPISKDVLDCVCGILFNVPVYKTNQTLTTAVSK